MNLAKTFILGVAGLCLANCTAQRDSLIEEVHCSHEDIVKEIAGEEAVDCGFVHPGQEYDFEALDESRVRADACVERAFEAGTPFHVRYWYQRALYEAEFGYASPGGRILVETYYGLYFDHNRKIILERISQTPCSQPVFLDRSERWHEESTLIECADAVSDIGAIACQASGPNPPPWPTPWASVRN